MDKRTSKSSIDVSLSTMQLCVCTVHVYTVEHLSQDMEVSPSELMNIMNKIISKRKTCLSISQTTLCSFYNSFWSFVLHFYSIFNSYYTFLYVLHVCMYLMYICNGKLLFYISDGDLRTDGFTIESCRSMVAVMDVSFHLSSGLH